MLPYFDLMAYGPCLMHHKQGPAVIEPEQGAGREHNEG